MSSLSTLIQSEQEISLLANDGHVIWTLDTIESSMTVDVKGANPGFRFSLDTHVDAYDQEIKDIEAETQQTTCIKSIEDQLKTLAEVTEELRVVECLSIDRLSSIPVSSKRSSSLDRVDVLL